MARLNILRECQRVCVSWSSKPCAIDLVFPTTSTYIRVPDHTNKLTGYPTRNFFISQKSDFRVLSLLNRPKNTSIKPTKSNKFKVGDYYLNFWIKIV